MSKRPPSEPVEELRRIIEEEEGGEEEVENGLEQGLGLPEAIRHVLVRLTPSALGFYTVTQRRYGLDDRRHARFIDLTWRLLVHQTFRSPLQEDGRPYVCVQAFEDLYLREVRPLLGTTRDYDHYWQRAYAAISMVLSWVVRILGDQRHIAVDWPSARCYGPMEKAVLAIKNGTLHSGATRLYNTPLVGPGTFSTMNASVLPGDHLIQWFTFRTQYGHFPDREAETTVARFDQDMIAHFDRVGEMGGGVIAEVTRDADGKIRSIKTRLDEIGYRDEPVTFKSTAVAMADQNPIALIGTGFEDLTYRYRDQPVLVAYINGVLSRFNEPDNIYRDGDFSVVAFHLDRYLAYLVDDYKQAPDVDPRWPINAATLLMSAILRRNARVGWPAVTKPRVRSFKALNDSVLSCIAAQRGFVGPYVPGGDGPHVRYFRENEGVWYFSVDDGENLIQTRFSDQAMLLQFASLGYDAFMALPETTVHPFGTMARSMLELMREPENDNDYLRDWLRPGLSPETNDPAYVAFGKHALACDHVANTPSLATHARFDKEKKMTVFVCEECMI
jgi:hypothetical protein